MFCVVCGLWDVCELCVVYRVYVMCIVCCRWVVCELCFVYVVCCMLGFHCVL